MTQIPREKEDAASRKVKPDEVEKERGSYYYDDAHGYQTFDPRKEEDDDGGHCGEKPAEK